MATSPHEWLCQYIVDHTQDAIHLRRPRGHDSALERRRRGHLWVPRCQRRLGTPSI